MEKPHDDPTSAGEPKLEIPIDAGDVVKDTELTALATVADDFRRDWEKRGRPQGILGRITTPLDPPQLTAEEIERILQTAKQAEHLWPQLIEAQAVAEQLKSWSAVHDSTLTIIRENPELLTGLSATAGLFPAIGLKPSTELAKLAEPPTLLNWLGRLPTELETMNAFPLRHLLTETLSRVAIRYIRQTTPGLSKPEASPSRREARGTGPRKEKGEAAEKPVSSRTGESLVNTAATALALLDSDLREQVAIVRTPAEWEMLRQMKAEGKGEEITSWLEKRAQEAIRACKGKLGMRRGRKRKLESEKEYHKLALKVVAALPQFERGMLDKKELNRRRVRNLEQGLKALKYPPDLVECLMRYTRPVSAVCGWVSMQSSPARDIQTVRNYLSKFRKLFAASKPDPREDKS